MHKQLILIAITLLIILIPNAAAQNCEAYNTPDISMPDQFTLSEDKSFSYDVDSTSIDDQTTFTYTLLNTTFPSFQIRSDGLISFTPRQEDTGNHKVLIVAYSDNDCYDSKIVRFNVRDKPSIESIPTPGEVETREGRGLRFSAQIEDTDSENHTYTWKFNQDVVSTSDHWNYLPGYNESGTHDLTLEVEDDTGLSTTTPWVVIVQNVNRAPVQIKEIPGVSMRLDRTLTAFDLTNYFIDPDGDDLEFTAQETRLEYDTPLKRTNITIRLRDRSTVRAISPKQPGYTSYEFIATDEHGKSVISQPVKFQALRSEDSPTYCGDDYCSAAESCSTCSQDCGACDNICEENWQCLEWSACQPSGIQTRTCQDLNQCGSAKEKPVEARECEYTPTCSDGIKNQGEDKVDCGGPCGPCGTCTDDIKNQGEEGVDCGGPCDKQCASCQDNIKNQNETDVDCGGNCKACGPGKTCSSNFDCASFKCRENICQPATCDDNIQNGGEKGKDCGGPCMACPTCEDNTLNQGEVQVDCGGPNCPACATCNDGIKNQDEIIPDCGGPNCKACNLIDYISYLEYKTLFLMFLGFLILFIAASNAFLKSETYYNMTNGGFFSFLESDRHLSKVLKWNKITRPFRFGKTLDYHGAAEQTIKRLRDAKPEKEELVEIMDNYFKSLFSLPTHPTYGDVYKAIKTSKAPFLTKFILANLLRKYWYIKRESVVMREEAARLRRDSIRIISELQKDL